MRHGGAGKIPERILYHEDHLFSIFEAYTLATSELGDFGCMKLWSVLAACDFLGVKVATPNCSGEVLYTWDGSDTLTGFEEEDGHANLGGDLLLLATDNELFTLTIDGYEDTDGDRKEEGLIEVEVGGFRKGRVELTLFELTRVASPADAQYQLWHQG